MGRRMAKHIQGIRVFVRKNLQFYALLDRPPQIDQITAVFDRLTVRSQRAVIGINLRCKRSIRQPRRNALRDVIRRRAACDIFYAAIRKSDVNRVHTLHAWKENLQAYRRAKPESSRPGRSEATYRTLSRSPLALIS